MNTRIARPALFAAGALSLAMVMWSGATAVARHNSYAPPASTVVATVDLELVLRDLKERTDKESSLKANLAEAQKKVDKLVDDLKSEQSKVEAMVAGPEKDKAIKELREMAIRAEFEKQYNQKLLIETQAEMLRDMYMKITDAARREAKAKGYHLVLTSDERIEIPKSDPEAISRAISMKRMLYVDPALDITADLVTKMNNEYAARK